MIDCAEEGFEQSTLKINTSKQIAHYIIVRDCKILGSKEGKNTNTKEEDHSHYTYSIAVNNNVYGTIVLF